MASRVPPAIHAKIDHWLELQCLSPKDWRIQPVSDSGQSVAQIWRLAPLRDREVEQLESDANGVNNLQLGFAVRNWGRPSRDRKSIQQILFFQKAAHIGLLKSNSGISLAGDFRHSSIVPDVMAWPDQSWCIEYASSIWTLESWRPGIALGRNSVVSDSLLQQAFDVFDRLHTVGRQLGVQRIVAPGLIERTKRMANWSSIGTAEWNQRIDDQRERISMILDLSAWKAILGRTLERLHRQEASIRIRFHALLSSPVDCHWIVRDLWRDNILVDCDRISGIIDFGAARIDWPILEIVRWISSWLQPDDPRISKLFETSETLSIDDFRFFDHSATLLALLQWLHWLLFGNMAFEGREHRVRSRIEELDRRLAKYSMP